TVLTNVSATALISRSNCPGSLATFNTTPSGTGPFSFVWLKDGKVQSTQTNNSWTISPVSAVDAGTYSVTVNNACGTVTNSATLTVLTIVSATALSSLTNCPGDSVVFSTTPSGSGPFSFAWGKYGSVVSGLTYI